MIVCLCHDVSHHDIARAVDEGCASFDELQDELRVATACGACHDCAHRVYHEAVCGPKQAAQRTGQPAPVARHEQRPRPPMRQLIRMPVSGAWNGAESRAGTPALDAA
ncbi:(2Fe-2S)-binding protein [Piscinibacter koreensis]|uniref:Bacterioferritin-associated ferredoxin n=1 Tax=Piscinibacter koreensis TaxID=2742824 RepID=A0A7Y6NPS6_9BURK|nr:(2Fe-2S)-binding protein [Schlegelella koreensis]NUZ06997.1 (2Fe-2S)-binding protein [Schlegelella koreensis]